MRHIPHVIVIDVGGTNFRVGVLGPAGELVSVPLCQPTPNRHTFPDLSLRELQELLLGKITDGVAECEAKHLGLDLPRVGIAFGAVISHSGIVENASMLWHTPARGYDLLSPLKRALPDKDITVINDVSAAAWRYSTQGRFLLITVSTGIGNKIFDPRLTGHLQLAMDPVGLGGEMGHVVANPMIVEEGIVCALQLLEEQPEAWEASLLYEITSGDRGKLRPADWGLAAARGDAFIRDILEQCGIPWCECGNLADLCSYASGPGAVRLAQLKATRDMDAFRGSLLGRSVAFDKHAITTTLLAKAARKADEFTSNILHESTKYLAMRIIGACADSGISKVIITGGFANGIGKPWFQRLDENIRTWLHPSGFFSPWTDEDISQLICPAPDYCNDSLIGVGRLVQEKAVQYHAFVKPSGIAKLELMSRPLPVCGAQQILAKMHYAGICSTDLQIFRGNRDFEPGVLGHEGLASVVSVGKAIFDLKPGDKIAINPNNPRDEDDKIGHSRDGFFQEYFLFDQSMINKGQIIHLPENIRPEWSLLELLACVVNAQNRLGDLTGKRVWIAGAGITGLLHVLLARQRGARQILLSNRSSGRFDLVKATGIVDPGETQTHGPGLGNWLKAKTEGFWPDILIVASADNGGRESLISLLPYLAAGASVHLFGGFLRDLLWQYPGNPTIDLGEIRNKALQKAVIREDGSEIMLMGSRGSTFADYETARALVVEDHIVLEQLVTHYISPTELPTVMVEMADKGTVHGEPALRVIVDFISDYGDTHLKADNSK